MLQHDALSLCMHAADVRIAKLSCALHKLSKLKHAGKQCTRHRFGTTSIQPNDKANGWMTNHQKWLACCMCASQVNAANDVSRHRAHHGSLHQSIVQAKVQQSLLAGPSPELVCLKCDHHHHHTPSRMSLNTRLLLMAQACTLVPSLMKNTFTHTHHPFRTLLGMHQPAVRPSTDSKSGRSPKPLVPPQPARQGSKITQHCLKQQATKGAWQ